MCNCCVTERDEPACAPTAPCWSHGIEASLSPLPWQKSDEEHHPSRGCSPCWVASCNRKDPDNLASLSKSLCLLALIQVGKLTPATSRPELKILFLDADLCMSACDQEPNPILPEKRGINQILLLRKNVVNTCYNPLNWGESILETVALFQDKCHPR